MARRDRGTAGDEKKGGGLLTAFIVLLIIVIWIAIFALEFLFKTPFFITDKVWIKVGLYALLNVAFIAYDVFITVLVRFYLDRLRPRLKHLLK